jgi:hypothetical protein
MKEPAMIPPYRTFRALLGTSAVVLGAVLAVWMVSRFCLEGARPEHVVIVDRVAERMHADPANVIVFDDVIVNNSVTDKGSLTLSGSIAPAALAGGATNDYNPAGLATISTLNQDASAPSTLTGIAALPAGRELLLINTSAANTITLTNEDASSAPANRFALPNGSSLAIQPGGAVLLRYAGTATRWRAVASSSSVSGSGTLNTLAKFTSPSAIGNSSITDNGVTIASTESLALATGSGNSGTFGDLVLPVNTKFSFSSSGFVTSLNTVVQIQEQGLTHQAPITAALGSTNSTQMDTTAHVATCEAFAATTTCSKTSVANALQNYGISCNVSGGDTNLCLISTAGHGGMRVDDASQFGTVTTGNLSTTAATTADLSASTDVKLGTNVEPFIVPGSASTTATIVAGGALSVDGTEFQCKNTIAANATTGIEIKADTTLNSSVRGVLTFFRGAGGGAGGNARTDIVRMGGAAFCVDGSAEDTCIRDVNGTGSTNATIRFSTDSANAHTGFFLNGTGDIVVNSELNATDAATHGHMRVTGNGIPALSSCGSPSAPKGTDTAFTFVPNATTCTVTFNQPFTTNAPACNIFHYGSATPPTCTFSTTAITCSTIVSGDTYAVTCWGVN